MEYTNFLRNTIDSKVPLEHMGSDNLLDLLLVS